MKKNYNIFILEDNDEDLGLVKRELKKFDFEYSLFTAKNRKEYLQLFESNTPDIVLSDYSLPDINGEEALIILLEKYPIVPFILVSGSIGEEGAIELMIKGAKDFILKDNLKRLLPAVNRELKSYEDRLKSKSEENQIELQRQQIIKTKDFYGNILENIASGVWVTDKDDIIQYANQEMGFISGISVDDIVSKSIVENFDEKTTGKFIKHYNKVKEALFPSEYEVEITTPGGKYNIQQGWLVPLIVNDKFTGMICTVEDVTEKVNLRNKIDENRRKMKTLVSNLPGMAYRCLVDDNWTMTYVSEGVEELTGYTPEEIIDNKVISFNDIIDPDEAIKDWDFLYKAIKKNEHYEAEYQIIKKCGEKRWVWERAVPVGKNDDGYPITEGFVIDITERKKAEANLEISNDIINRSPVVAFRWKNDDEWTVEYVSDNVADLIGYSSNDFYENRVSYTMIVHEDDLSEVQKEIANYSLQDSIKQFSHKFYRIVTKDNAVKWVKDDTYIIRDKDDNIIAFEGIIADVTEIVEYREKLEKSEYDLKRGEIVGKFGYWEIDLNDNSVKLSEGAKSIFGFKKENITLTMMRNIPLEEYQIKNTIAFNELVQNGVPYNVEYKFMCQKSNEIKYIHSIADFDQIQNKAFGVVKDVTDHKSLENKLSESNEKFLSLYHNSPDMYVSVDADSGLIIECNHTLCKTLGLKRDDILQKPIFDMYHEESLDKAHESFNEFKNNGKVTNKHLILKKANGDKLHVNLNVESVKDEDGIILHSISSWRDISELIEYDKALEESEKQYRELVNTISSGVAVYKVINEGKTGDDYIVQTFNKTALEMENKTIEQVVGKSLKDLRPNIDDFGLIPVFREVWKTGKAGYQPSKIYIDDNYSNWYENRVYKLSTGEIVAIFDDVTERMKYENELNASLDREKEMADIVRNAPLAIAYGYLDGKLENCNDAFADLTGYTLNELKDINWSKVLTPEKWIKTEQEYLSELKPENNRIQYEKEYIHKSGKIIPVELTVTAIFDSNGDLIHFIGFISDITFRKQAEENMLKLSTAVEQSPAVVVITNTSGKIDYVNPKFTELTGYSSDEAINKFPNILKSNEMTSDIYNKLWETIKSGETWKGEFINKRKDGSLYWENAIINPVKDNEGNIINYMKISEDITDQKKIEEELEEHREHLEELVKKRTKEITENNIELERLNKLFLNREHRIKELRDELKKYEK